MLAVLPATHRVDVSRVADFFAAYYVDLASEDECGQRFADCELGAVPPFGSKYGMRTIVDRSLLDDEQIVFEGNSHVEAIRMRCDDFIALEDPVVGDFTHGD